MKNSIKKLSFIVCVLLVLSPIFSYSIQAQALMEFEYDEENYYDGIFHLSEDNFLVYQYAEDYYSTRDYTYNYKLSKINKSGIQSELTMYDGVRKIIDFNNQKYFFHYNTKNGQLHIYDQELQLFDQQQLDFPIPLPYSSKIKFVQHNNYVALETYLSVGTAYFDKVKKSVIYDLNTKALVPDLSLPVTHVRGDIDPLHNPVLHLSDSLNRVVKSIKLNPLGYFKGEIRESALVVDNTIVYFSSEYDRSAKSSILHIYTTDLSANLISQQTLKHPNGYLQPSLENNMIKLNFHEYGKDSIVYYYNPQTNTLSDAQIIAADTRKDIINDYFYKDTQYNANYDLVKDSIIHINGNTIYSLNGEYIEYSALDDYLVIYDNYNENVPAKVFDNITGQEAFQLPANHTYRFINNDYIYAISGGYNYVTSKYTKKIGKLIARNADEIETEQRYEANKMWTVTLSKPIDPNSINPNNIYVVDASHKRIETSITYENNQLFIAPPANGYESGQTYKLYVNQLSSTDGDALEEAKSKTFTIR